MSKEVKKDLIAIAFVVLLGIWVASSYVDISNVTVNGKVIEAIAFKN